MPLGRLSPYSRTWSQACRPAGRHLRQARRGEFIRSASEVRVMPILAWNYSCTNLLVSDGFRPGKHAARDFSQYICGCFDVSHALLLYPTAAHVSLQDPTKTRWPKFGLLPLCPRCRRGYLEPRQQPHSGSHATRCAAHKRHTLRGRSTRWHVGSDRESLILDLKLRCSSCTCK